MKRFDAAVLRALSAQAASTPRLRKNNNLHATASDPIQRMLNAFEPGTYVRPHRHADKWELFVLLSGRAAALTFDDSGRVLERAELDMADENRVVEIPANAWHTIVSLAPQTVLFEIKPGPYVPTSAKDYVDWAPPEGDPAAGACEQWLRAAQTGQALTGDNSVDEHRIARG